MLFQPQSSLELGKKVRFLVKPIVVLDLLVEY